MSNASILADGSPTPPPGSVIALEGDTGGPVGPDGSGIINTIGGGGLVVSGNAGTNTLTFTQSTQIPWIARSTPGPFTPANNTGYINTSTTGVILFQMPFNPPVGTVFGFTQPGATNYSLFQIEAASFGTQFYIGQIGWAGTVTLQSRKASSIILVYTGLDPGSGVPFWNTISYVGLFDYF